VDFLLVLIELFSLGVTAEALRAKVDRKSAISLQRVQFNPKFQVEGSPQPIIFARIVRPMNAFVANSFHTLSSRLSSSEVRFYIENGRFAFFQLSGGGLRGTYDDHLRRIGKRVVTFLSVN